jgi:hypothetical protein
LTAKPLNTATPAAAVVVVAPDSVAPLAVEGELSERVTLFVAVVLRFPKASTNTTDGAGASDVPAVAGEVGLDWKISAAGEPGTTVIVAARGLP